MLVEVPLVYVLPEDVEDVEVPVHLRELEGALDVDVVGLEDELRVGEQLRDDDRRGAVVVVRRVPQQRSAFAVFALEVFEFL